MKYNTDIPVTDFVEARKLIYVKVVLLFEEEGEVF